MKKIKSLSKIFLVGVVLCFAFLCFLCVKEKDKVFAESMEHTGATVFSITSGGIASGTYYLENDFTATGMLEIYTDNTVNICLCGHVFDLGGYHLENYGTLNIYDCNSAKGTHYVEYDENNRKWVLTSTQNKNVISGGIITNGGAASSGCAINNASELNIYGGNIICNSTTGDGGAIYNTGFALLKNCNIAYNYASNGGAVYNYSTNDNQAITTIIDSTIEHNTASSDGNGGGIYAEYVDEGCFASGTKITMVDGTTKNVEDVVCGDVVKTFDHETGTISSEKVCLAFKGEKEGQTFTLNFSNNISISIFGGHDFFERSTLNYVKITKQNAKDYVGKYFYNANTQSWVELQSVTENTGNSDYYAIYTVHHQNCVANNLLSMADDIGLFFAIFEYDENLKINDEQRQADIEQYGLFDFSNCQVMDEEYYDNFNIKYANIVIGKGLSTYAKLFGIFMECYDDPNNSQSSPSATSLSLVQDYWNNSNINTYIILGSKAVVRNNSLLGEDGENNIYLGEDCSVAVVKDSSNINAGITLENTTGEFAKQIVAQDSESQITSAYASSFHCDSGSGYEVTFSDNALSVSEKQSQSNVPTTGVVSDTRIATLALAVMILLLISFVVLLKKKKSI